jgi:hypothetical protein
VIGVDMRAEQWHCAPRLPVLRAECIVDVPAERRGARQFDFDPSVDADAPRLRGMGFDYFAGRPHAVQRVEQNAPQVYCAQRNEYSGDQQNHPR